MWVKAWRTTVFLRLTCTVAPCGGVWAWGDDVALKKGAYLALRVIVTLKIKNNKTLDQDAGQNRSRIKVQII